MEIIYLCPSAPTGSCLWEGSACDIESHFEECHSDYFLESNFINLKVSEDNTFNYLMSLFGESYLVQTSYSADSQILELKLRYLGNASKAAQISYYLEVISGNFGFSSKSNYSGYNTVTNTNRGSVEVDVQGIKLTCGKHTLEYLLGYIHIENTLTRFGHRSIKRRHYDKKSLEPKVRVSFRHKAEKTKRKSMDERQVSFTEEVPICEFIREIVEDLIKEALGDGVELGDDEQDSNGGSITFARRYSESNIYHFGVTNYTPTPQYHQAIISNREDDRHELVVSNTHAPTAEMPNLEYIENQTPVEELEESVFVLETTDETESEDGKSEEYESPYEKRLKAIRCQKCGMYMIPPIYLCLKGHSVCSACKNLSCDVCGYEVTDLRNADLEEVSRGITHPCRFAEKGCNEYLSPYEIRHHEIYCEYFKYTCPLCGVFGKFLEVKNHFRLIHPSVKIVETSECAFAKDSELIVANKYGLFFCTSQVHNASIEWKVDFCGVERVGFGCEVVLKNKKQSKTYALQRQGNSCNRVVFLSELKAARLKEKNAVLFIKPC